MSLQSLSTSTYSIPQQVIYCFGILYLLAVAIIYLLTRNQALFILEAIWREILYFLGSEQSI